VAPEFIARTRTALGPAPRALEASALPALDAAWLVPKDPLHDLWKQRHTLARTGHVTMGYVIQANNLLWSPSSGDCPAQLVYAAKPWAEDVPIEILRTIAGECIQLRGQKWVDPALARMAALLDAELDRVFDETIPPVLAFGANVKTGATLIPRSFLPFKYLTMSMLPLFVPEDSPYVLPVPAAFWDKTLVEIAGDARAWT
jgi:hypothetical protein